MDSGTGEFLRGLPQASEAVVLQLAVKGPSGTCLPAHTQAQGLRGTVLDAGQRRIAV